MTREATTSDHLERLNRTLLYIQDHLEDPLSLDVLAAKACFSPFHFHRIFAAYAGETVSGYVRRLRLEWAANRLCHTGNSVTDIALSAGYETPGAFNKAFKKYFRQSPSSFRKRQRTMLMPTTSLVISRKKEDADVQAEIRELKDQKVIFVRGVGSYGKAAEKAWSSICRYAFPRRLVSDNAKFIGVSYDDPEITPEDKLRYDACITVDKEVTPKGEVGVQTIAGGRYAVFLHEGPYDNLGQTYGEIFAQWLPSSGEELRDAPCFELYLNDVHKTKPADLKTEIHVPLK